MLYSFAYQLTACTFPSYRLWLTSNYDLVSLSVQCVCIWQMFGMVYITVTPNKQFGCFLTTAHAIWLMLHFKNHLSNCWLPAFANVIVFILCYNKTKTKNRQNPCYSVQEILTLHTIIIVTCIKWKKTNMLHIVVTRTKTVNQYVALFIKIEACLFCQRHVRWMTEQFQWGEPLITLEPTLPIMQLDCFFLLDPPWLVNGKKQLNTFPQWHVYLF